MLLQLEFSCSDLLLASHPLWWVTFYLKERNQFFLSKNEGYKSFSADALHLAHLIASHGYLFQIDDHVLTVKNDGTFYRFQTPYFWPSNCWEPENTDYGKFQTFFGFFKSIPLKIMEAAIDLACCLSIYKLTCCEGRHVCGHKCEHFIILW